MVNKLGKCVCFVTTSEHSEPLLIEELSDIHIRSFHY